MTSTRVDEHVGCPQRLFEANLSLITHVATHLSRKGGLPPHEAEEYVAWAIARLIYDRYAVLRKFRRQSNLRTFLRTVLGRLLLDYRNARWGRWRSSEIAKRLGPPAEMLERLVYRDRLPVREAIEHVKARYPGCLREAAAVLAQLPVRWLPRVVPEAAAAGLAHSDTDVFDQGQKALVEVSVRQIVGEFDPIDAKVVQLLFWRGESVAQIARQLGLDPKGLYRRLDRLKLRLRNELAARGIDRETALAVVGRVAA